MSKALILANQLKPDVRLGLSLSNFSRALDDNHRQRFAQLRANSAATPLASDVIKVTEELNREGAKRHRGWKPFSTRLGKFLSRIQSLASIGDVLIGGSQNLIASGVWCAVRVCLESVIGFLGYYDKISSLFMKLGTTWSLYNDFARLFTESNELQSFLLEYFIGIVRLCEKIVLFARKSTLAQFAASMMSSYDNEFNPLLEEIEQWGTLIEQKSNLLSNQFTHKSESKAIERNTKLIQYMSTSSKLDRKYRLFQMLSQQHGTCNYEFLWRRQRQKGTCHWIFKAPAYQSWCNQTTSCILWVSGSMGSGKTVTLANIVADVHIRQPCLYFFCVSKEPESLSFKSFLNSLACQILKDLPADAPFWTSLNLDEITTKLTTRDGVADLILRAMPDHEKYFLVVDGLENCNKEEGEDIVRFILQLMKTKTILLCCSGLTASDTHTNLLYGIQGGAKKLYITLNNEGRCNEIEDFIVREVERRTALRPLEAPLKNLIVSQLLSGAQGMYLWVALQLEAMLPMNSKTVISEADIHQILQNLPKDLPEAYDQALKRVKDTRYGSNPFKVVAASNRPLTLDEFQVAVTVVPGNIIWNPKALPLDPSAVVYVCSGNLLEIDEEDGKVYFIHHSALAYLLSNTNHHDNSLYRFSPADADLYMGSICVTYLNYGIFCNMVATQRKLYATQVPEKVVGAITRDHRTLKPLLGYILKHHRKKASINLDITSQVLSTQDQRMEESLSFLPYATLNWLDHTGTFDYDMDLWHYWKILVVGELDHVQLPWTVQGNQMSKLKWATLHSHGALFKCSFWSELIESNILLVPRWTGGNPERLQIGSQWLSDVVAWCMTVDSVDWTTIKYYLDAGASPFRKHRQLNKCPIELLVTRSRSKGSSKLGFNTAEKFLDHHAIVLGVKYHGYMEDVSLAALLSGMIAANTCQNITVRLIRLGIGVNMDPPKNSPLGAAVHTGNKDLTEELLQAGACPSKSFFNSMPAIIVAIISQDEGDDQTQRATEIVQLLLKYESVALFTLNTFHIDGKPLLCSEVNSSTIYLALQCGANPNVRTSDGRTPLHIYLTKMLDDPGESEKYSLKKTISTLLEHGANPNIKSYVGDSCMEIGILLGKSSILHELLRKGGNANERTRTGATLLHLAALMDNKKAFDLLLQYGASTSAKDMMGQTPLQRAGPIIKKKHVDQPKTSISWLAD